MSTNEVHDPVYQTGWTNAVCIIHGEQFLLEEGRPVRDFEQEVRDRERRVGQRAALAYLRAQRPNDRHMNIAGLGDMYYGTPEQPCGTEALDRILRRGIGLAALTAAVAAAVWAWRHIE